MTIEVKVPQLPESVADATVASWHKKVGDVVHIGDNIVDLETDKVVLEVPSNVEGIIESIECKTGDTVLSGQLLLKIKEGATVAPQVALASAHVDVQKEDIAVTSDAPTSPAVRRMMSSNDVAKDAISGSGKAGRITKDDVKAHLSGGVTSSQQPTQVQLNGRGEKRVPMTRLRAKIAARLVEAQHNAAMLTTFNEVNLKNVMELRSKYKDQFEKVHGVKLGFMSFFTRAVVEALKLFPSVNASIDGTDIIYHEYFDIGIAVSTDRGLVVPVVRDTDKMTIADIERSIGDYASRARDGKLSIEEMQGGTFTITNGGVFGSLLATPIINPPQTGILGMHKIEDRPIVENGEIVIRPMMYVALSYDHRIIDGKESVQFLVAVKNYLEDPARLLLNI
jgi:2-oxoglutarate dehydrogenase E2 component (dihydrolipoamide succinyltransferase)